MKLDANGHCAEDLHIAIGDRRVLMDGMTVRGNGNEFVAVDLGMEADPLTFTPEVIASERRGMPGWRFKKEYLRDWDAQNGAPVFGEECIDWQRANAIDPIRRLDLHIVRRDGIIQRDARGHKKYILVQKKKGRLRVFVEPDTPPPGFENTDELRARMFGAGMDVGAGVEKSDSTLVFMAADNREVVATLACNKIRPGQLGRFAVAAGKFYNDALICCVGKMHGLTALRAIADAGYPRIWRETRPRAGITEVRTKNLGWPYGEGSSELLMGRWVEAMEENLTVIRCLETIEQHRQYIYDEMGRVCHQRLKSLPTSVREKHGDLVIGAALAYRACIDLPKYKIVTAIDAPQRSAAGRRAIRDKQRRQKDEGGW